jgi:hypothetical protein
MRSVIFIDGVLEGQPRGCMPPWRAFVGVHVERVERPEYLSIAITRVGLSTRIARRSGNDRSAYFRCKDRIRLDAGFAIARRVGRLGA